MKRVLTHSAALLAAAGFIQVEVSGAESAWNPDGGQAVARSLEPQGPLTVRVGDEEYVLPAAGVAGRDETAPPPVHAGTLAAIERWRTFAWDADKEEYRYRFAVTPETSTAIVLTPDDGGREIAEELDRAAALVRELLGEERVPHDFVTIVCPSRREYLRAVEFAVEGCSALDLDSFASSYVNGAWRAEAERSPSFFLPYSGTTGCVEEHSEMWSPMHEIVRGFAQVACVRQAPRLTHVNPLMVGLSWNVEYDVLGDILSIPYWVGFQAEGGRGKWRPATIARVVDAVERRAEKDDRAPALADLPYLRRGEGLPEAGASIAWSVSRHLARHHTAALPQLLQAISDRVQEIHQVTHADGSTSFTLDPGYQLPWSEVQQQWASVAPDCDWEHLTDCITKRCKHCRTWAADRDLAR